MTAVNGRLAGAALQPETQAAAPTHVLLHTKLHTTSLLLLVSNRTLLQHFSVTQPPQSAQFQLCSRVFIVLADFYRAVH